MSSVLALVTVTWTPFCWRAAARGRRDRDRDVAEFDHFGDVVAFDAHLDGAEGDFEDIFVDFALHDSDLVHGLQTYMVAGRDVAEQVRLGVGVAWSAPVRWATTVWLKLS